ncbi:MAG: hypothetical protein GC180_11845 [Bacteroidetes bacterium]|nr:hypothetical protein [Bacteroidota bacterium]
MKRIALIIGLLFSTGVIAQQVNYKILSDDPKNVKAFSLSLEPFYCDLSTIDIHMGWQVRADLLILKRMEVRGDFRKAYLDINGNNTGPSTDPTPVNGVKPAWYGEAGVSLFLFDKVRKTQTKLVLSQRTSGNYTYTKYIMIPAMKRKMFGIRGGIYNYRVAMELDSKNSAFFTMKSENGTIVKNTADANTVSMYFTSSIYGGLHWKSIIDVVAQTDYGKKKVGAMSDFYIDVLFSPVVQFGNVTQSNTTYSLDPNNDKLKRIGWRAGWQVRHPNKVWLSCKAEFGARPGFKSTDKIGFDSERIYMMFSVGINIPAGKKKEK